LSWQHFTVHKVRGNSEETLSHREVSRYQTFIGCRYVHRLVVKGETTLHRITEVRWICLGKLASRGTSRSGNTELASKKDEQTSVESLYAVIPISFNDDEVKEEVEEDERGPACLR
ncbi:hypothetical protein V1478_017431, partial [Vespula squamosa]